MSLKLGQTAPDFTAETTNGDVSFHEWLGESWGVLFSHPADWEQGQDVVILPSISDEQAHELFPAGFVTHKPYLRTTKLNN